MKRKYLGIASLLLVLIVGGFSSYLYNSSQNVKADSTNVKQEVVEEESEKVSNVADRNSKEKVPNKEAREKLEKITDEELKDALTRAKDKTGVEIGKEFTEEEIEILNTITPEEYYDLMGMTEEEVYNWLDVYHLTIDMNIVFAHQEGIDSETYNKEHRHHVDFEPEFKWIAENYEFETEYHNSLIKDIIKLMQVHKDGDNDALFALKSTLYELNGAYNPEKLKDSMVSLSDAEKIRNGEEPVFDYGS